MSEIEPPYFRYRRGCLEIRYADNAGMKYWCKPEGKRARRKIAKTLLGYCMFLDALFVLDICMWEFVFDDEVMI